MPSALRHSVLRYVFIFCVLCFAVFYFSENSVDNDLWGHVLFGQELLQTGHLARTEPYSWTAPGHPWINHEILAEAALGLAHRALGGPGLLLLKIVVGLLTLLLALAIAVKQKANEPQPPLVIVAWAFGALAVVEIARSFAARPQIFTALALATEFWLLTQIHAGRRHWALALPPLFALWINTHGGVLAGLLALFLTAACAIVQPIIGKFIPRFKLESVPGTTRWLWLALAASVLALFANPYGAGLVRWLVGSVQWLRPEIEEWNPIRLAAAGFLFSRRPLALWQIAVTCLFGFMAVRSARHAPLFCLTALAFAPPHLAGMLQRLPNSWTHWMRVFLRPAGQWILTVLLALAATGILFVAGTLHKERPWTMEIPRQYHPVAAIEFIKAHGLHGNLLVFFDWGEECLWELPDSRVSIDGRLDTCYPRDVITAQFKFYNAEPLNPLVLNPTHADVALLPSEMTSALQLAQRGGWQPVYVDDLALVLVREADQFPGLGGLKLPVVGTGTTKGRAAFPDRPSLRLERLK
jgi:hypothetical protein